MLLEGKKLLITGVLTEKSIAYAVAETAIGQGADVVLTGAGRGVKLTRRVARRLSGEPPVLEMDVTAPEQIEAVRGDLEERWGRVDGILHAIGFAPGDCLGGDFLDTPWESVQTALHVSTYSLASVLRGIRPLLQPGSSIVTLDFDATVAWPAYDWMGVAKAGLESTVRYAARDLGSGGVRVNAVCAGPLKTMAARSIPGFERFEDAWDERAPMGWDVTDPGPTARTVCALFSDWTDGVTGEMVHVDGGYHAMGA